MSLQRILMAGSGGQGIALLGRFIATVAMKTTPCLTFFPSYGAEVRGGTSNCQVILSDHEIPSPLADEFEVMLLMNQPSLERFLPRLTADGIAVINSSLCEIGAAPCHVMVAASEMADHLGDVRAANFVMLGAWLARRPLLSPADVEEGLQSFFRAKPRAAEINAQAFRAGLAANRSPWSRGHPPAGLIGL